MQFKSLIIALAAVAVSVSAQSIPDTPCSTCVMSSLPNVPTCASLLPVDMQQLQAVFANHAVDVSALATAVQNPAIKSCLCNWAIGTLTPTGAAASCIAAQGATPAACSATEAADATTRISPFPQILGCDAIASNATITAGGPTSTATSPSTASSTAAAPKATGATGSAASVGFSLNLDYVASVAVFGAAAFAGF
ncbi:hypothetical protein BGX26_006073 [Mortierella sp. AD094]|nr:hypothetical protein BGX26_006073 [Mortierella sp. AD094]